MSIGLRQFLYNTARVCGRKKLPCAEYSVVKDQSCQASPDNLFTSGTGRSATRAALKRSVPTSVQERPESPITPPKLFKERQTGGEYRSRTGDLLVANQALSQLS